LRFAPAPTLITLLTPSSCKSGIDGYVINISRGSVIDQQELVIVAETDSGDDFPFTVTTIFTLPHLNRRCTCGRSA
jgi:hypothetical protein